MPEPLPVTCARCGASTRVEPGPATLDVVRDHNMTCPNPLHQHVYDKWYPLNRKRIRRVCVIPGCHRREIKEAKA